jgi:hypothetical protein
MWTIQWYKIVNVFKIRAKYCVWECATFHGRVSKCYFTLLSCCLIVVSYCFSVLTVVAHVILILAPIDLCVAAQTGWPISRKAAIALYIRACCRVRETDLPAFRPDGGQQVPGTGAGGHRMGQNGDKWVPLKTYFIILLKSISCGHKQVARCSRGSVTSSSSC